MTANRPLVAKNSPNETSPKNSMTGRISAITIPTVIATEIMAEAIEGMEVGALDAARILLDDLTERYPDWAEAWNRRATLCFIEKRDADCLADIERTLALEPRHFGAISDFGHVCLRNGHLNEARAAFQIALSINPHLEELSEILEDLAPHNLMLH